MTTSRAVHSQAFTFMSYLQGGVDPRTGQYTVSLDFPEIKSNWLCGPDFLFNLNFNPINILDSGFGLGWNLNLSQFTPHNSILALSTGETFKVTGSGTEPAIKEKKLDSFHFYNNLNGTYRVVHKSGLIEELTVGGSGTDRVALPSRIYAPSGHSISLLYKDFRGGRHLHSVSDAQGELLRINREEYYVEILIKPDNQGSGKPLARYHMTLNDSGWVTDIVLPSADEASWRFDYGPGPIRGILCLHEVKTPVGGLETIEYGDGGHPYPGGVTRPNLPRVTCHRSYPGFEQPMMEVEFTYTPKNFLGAGETVRWEEGMDPLYNVAHTYHYGSTATLNAGGKAVRWIDRTYNRFHLLTEETTTQDHCVKREATTYYAEDIAFEFQPPQFQMPKQTKTSWEMDNDSTRYRAEVASSAFDENGNLIEEVDHSGVRTVHTYYPKEGCDDCPADPEGFIRNRKDSTVVPSPKGQAGAPTLRTRFRYTALQPLGGSGLKPWLANDSESLVEVKGSSEVELLHTLFVYEDQPGDAFLHGRPSSQRMILNDKSTTTKYTYGTLKSAFAGEQVLKTVETVTGFDHQGTEHVQKETTRETSLVHGQSLLSYDDSGVKIRSEYDELQRVILYTCKGIQPPIDPYCKAIARQVFRFDALDNLTLVITTSVDGVVNRATYKYENTDPTQLSKVENDAGSPYPAEILLEYDADGHLIRDEEQRVLTYDALGRLTQISGLPGEPPCGLGYDPLDILTSLEGGEGPEQRFYRGGELANRTQGAKSSTFVRAAGVVLAEHQAGADPKSLLLAADFKSTVLNEVSAGATNTLVYSAYGNLSAEQRVETALAYNGGLRETQNEVYLLGNGYRAYSPILMRFHCPDSWSPFEAGGLNPYAYCGGEPIMNADDSGHMYRPPRSPSPPALLPRPTRPSPAPVTQTQNAFRRKIAADYEKWDQHPAVTVKSVSWVKPAEALGSSSQSAASGHAAIQQQQSNAQRLPQPQTSRNAPQQVAAQAQSRPTPKPPKPVSPKEWSKMDVFKRMNYQERGGVVPTTVSVEKVRGNVFDSKKNSKKEGWS